MDILLPRFITFVILTVSILRPAESAPQFSHVAPIIPSAVIPKTILPKPIIVTKPIIPRPLAPIKVYPDEDDIPTPVSNGKLNGATSISFFGILDVFV